MLTTYDLPQVVQLSWGSTVGEEEGRKEGAFDVRYSALEISLKYYSLIILLFLYFYYLEYCFQLIIKLYMFTLGSIFIYYGQLGCSIGSEQTLPEQIPLGGFQLCDLFRSRNLSQVVVEISYFISQTHPTPPPTTKKIREELTSPFAPCQINSSEKEPDASCPSFL